jgi:hypothetical protein
MRHSLLGWPTWSALLRNTKGTSKRSLDFLNYSCFHGRNELLGEGFDLSGDVRVGVGHEVSCVFSCPPWYEQCPSWANRSKEPGTEVVWLCRRV